MTFHMVLVITLKHMWFKFLWNRLIINKSVKNIFQLI